MVSASEESVVGVMVLSPKYKSNSASATFASSIVYETSSGNVVSAEIEICRDNSLSILNMLSIYIYILHPSIYNAQHGDGKVVVLLFPIVLSPKTYKVFKENRSLVKDSITLFRFIAVFRGTTSILQNIPHIHVECEEYSLV